MVGAGPCTVDGPALSLRAGPVARGATGVRGSLRGPPRTAVAAAHGAPSAGAWAPRGPPGCALPLVQGRRRPAAAFKGQLARGSCAVVGLAGGVVPSRARGRRARADASLAAGPRGRPVPRGPSAPSGAAGPSRGSEGVAGPRREGTGGWAPASVSIRFLSMPMPTVPSARSRTGGFPSGPRALGLPLRAPPGPTPGRPPGPGPGPGPGAPTRASGAGAPVEP